MSGKTCVAVGLGFVLGAALLAPGHDARAQRQDPPRWEYKVVPFSGNITLADRQTKVLNDLAAEGWEYAGLVAVPSAGGGGQVAFKRAKR